MFNRKRIDELNSQIEYLDTKVRRLETAVLEAENKVVVYEPSSFKDAMLFRQAKSYPVNDVVDQILSHLKLELKFVPKQQARVVAVPSDEETTNES